MRCEQALIPGSFHKCHSTYLHILVVCCDPPGASPGRCLMVRPGKDFIPLSLSTCLNSFLTIFHPDPCVLPIQIFLPDHPVLLATFPLGPFLCLHFLLGTLLPAHIRSIDTLSTFKRHLYSISSSLPLPSSHPVPAPRIRSHDCLRYINFYVCMRHL